MLNQSEREIVEELKGRLKKLAGNHLQSVIVYGSRAWGQAGPDSDLDIAVIIQDCTPELETTLQESAYQVMWDHDFNPIIALKVFDADHFMALQTKGFSFYRKVAQEGIAL
jgi:predicted nucleotidyltransferase